MNKRISAILGVGLIVLWIVGLGNPNTSSWLTWMDGIAALCAFGIAAFTPDYATRSTRMGLPMAMSVALFAFWLIALSTGVSAGMTWWNFAFACAFLILGISNGAERPVPMVESTTTDLNRERERRRRTA